MMACVRNMHYMMIFAKRCVKTFDASLDSKQMPSYTKETIIKELQTAIKTFISAGKAYFHSCCMDGIGIVNCPWSSSTDNPGSYFVFLQQEYPLIFFNLYEFAFN